MELCLGNGIFVSVSVLSFLFNVHRPFLKKDTYPLYLSIVKYSFIMPSSFPLWN